MLVAKWVTVFVCNKANIMIIKMEVLVAKWVTVFVCNKVNIMIIKMEVRDYASG